MRLKRGFGVGGYGPSVQTGKVRLWAVRNAKSHKGRGLGMRSGLGGMGVR
jgi:hypothetical protein